MDPRLLRLYNRELQHLREMGGEFAEEFPKVAGRLGLEKLKCADPYVERLLEGFAFLTSRIQLKLEAEFPRFTQHLLEIVFPHYLAPTPAMTVVQMQPTLTEGALADGFVVPRHSVMRTPLGKGEQTACEFRTSSDVTLWPLELTEAEYFTHTRDLSTSDIPSKRPIRAGIRFRLRATAGLTFDKLPLDRLPLFLQGAGELPMRLYEQLLANTVAVVVRPASKPAPWQEVLDGKSVERMGFRDDQALLPHGLRSFEGYRLLHEYFTFPDRFMFVELTGLSRGVRRCKAQEIEILVLLDRVESGLQNALDASQFSLFCVPAINLFPKRTDRIHLDAGRHEYHIVPDRTRPMDYEVYEIGEVVGHGTRVEDETEFRPFYSATDLNDPGEDRAYYTVRREPRLLSAKQKRKGSRASYVGSEVYVSLVDGSEDPFNLELKQIGLKTLCTNRDLPLQMSVGVGRTDFTLEAGAPVESIRCVAGPTRPRPSWAEGDTTWRLISHLSLNYLSLTDTDEEHGAASLRELLSLYGDTADSAIARQIDGVRSVKSQPVTRRLPTRGPLTFGRGLEVTVAFDESAFEGSGIFLLGALLDEFFALYVSINSFTETVVHSLDRGEVMRWPVRSGRRLIL